MFAVLTYEEALQKLLEKVPQPRVVRLPLELTRGRILACEVRADLDLPPFRKSFMDGYAVRSSEVSPAPVRLKVIGTVAAGDFEERRIGAGQAAQVMTGAPVPPGADAVQVVEKTRKVSSSVVEILESVNKGENIAPKGSEVVSGTVALERGRVVGAAEVGVLATLGRKTVEVYSEPSAAVISTGNELVKIDQQPRLGQIRNSNSHLLWAQCGELGLEATILPIVPDHPEKIRAALRAGLEKDLVLLSGGVSMGEFDFVSRVLAEEGLEIFFHKVALKPGKPVLVGRKGGHMVFGLPGNPVSAFVTFELFVRPVVRKWMGFKQFGLQRVRAELLQCVQQKPGRLFFKPAHTFWRGDGFRVQPMETKGSSDLVGFSRADSLLVMDAETTRLEEGARVDVVLLENHPGRGVRSSLGEEYEAYSS